MSHNKVLVFNKDGYDPFIDFIKGVSICGVILTHTISASFHQWSLFCLWGDLAVPLFLLIQVFHACKKGIKQYRLDVKKLVKRIIIPFVIAQFFIVCLLILLRNNNMDGVFAIIKQFGNLGPGSYYIYIYLQFALLLFLPRLFSLNNQNSKFKSLKIFCLGVVISIILEIASCLLIDNSEVYRFIFIRYIFLFFLGWIITVKGVKINLITLVLSLLSIFSILVFNYTEVDLWPFFWSKSWRIFHWISYFYVAWLLLFILNRIYYQIEMRCKFITQYFISCGKWSYEIFIFQMVYFVISPMHILANKLGDSEILLIIVNLLDLAICTITIILLKNKRFFAKNNWILRIQSPD